ncbi:HBL073Wp [Eremothecium sinecaudum]|uniref:Mitochondrial distribution and morphology protein 10 n=1 Tax=Eremothecium sinecaudum TaxID=45286 RepID=A0A120K0Y6_9SACH|nr:HBL073Wp [Eremothecium sinecaudum]AMD18829.1 HBL073Wp [Eremothecium sinecaudum]
MIEYMEYIVRQFERSTGWNRDNSYENITATSDNVLQLQIPSSFNLQVSNQSTPYTFTTFELSNHKVINGSLSYLYTDCNDMKQLVQASTDIRLHTMVDTFRFIKPYCGIDRRAALEAAKGDEFVKHTLLYGRMYYPGSILEAMYCRRLTQHMQLVLKGLSWVNQPSFVTVYLQRDTGSTSQELIYSSNESLLGYRFLHNCLSSKSKLYNSIYNDSLLSFGAEFWLGIANMLPGCSTTLRYFTHATNTCKPITLTLSFNPLFGHISSTYSVKPTLGSTLSAKYDFNVYSIESDLTFGCELWKSSSALKLSENLDLTAANRVDATSAKTGSATGKEIARAETRNTKSQNIATVNNGNFLDKMNATISFLDSVHNVKSPIEEFAKMINNTQFTSVLKCSSSINNKNLKILWEGKYKEILISAGAELTNLPLDAPKTLSDDNSGALARPVWLRPAKFGVMLQYST